LTDLAGDLRHLAESDSIGDLREEATRNALEIALGEVAALEVLLDPSAERRYCEESIVVNPPSRLRLGRTAGTLTAVAEDLLWMRDAGDGNPARVGRANDARVGLTVALGELVAVRRLLDARHVEESKGADGTDLDYPQAA
jgi:hypothetical protein